MKRFTVRSVSVAACALCLALACQPAFATEAEGASTASAAEAAIVQVVDQPAAASSATGDTRADASVDAAAATETTAAAATGDATATATAAAAATATGTADVAAADDSPSVKTADANASAASADVAANGSKDSDGKAGAVAADYRGWVTDDDGTYFYNGGVKVTGDYIIGGKSYHFDEETGAMVHGWLQDKKSKTWRYYSPDTGVQQRGEAYLPSEDDDAASTRHWYYFDPATGARLSGWQWVESASKWAYYDAETGQRLSGQQFIPCGNNAGDEYHWYYFDESTGAVQYGWKWIAEDDKWVYYEPVVGWMDYGEDYVPCDNTDDAESSWYYFNPDTGAVTYGWQHLDSDDRWVCYEQDTGKMFHGQQYLHANAEDKDYHWYLFDEETGAVSHGLTWVSDDHKGALYDQVMGWMLYGWHDVDGVSYNLRDGDGALIEVRCANDQVSSYVNWMLSIAADDSHGYDQEYRWGERGDYDCSSLVVSALRTAGLETSEATYTGNMVYNLTRNGFSWLGDFSNLQIGDILLNEKYHTAVYLGGGLLVHASGNEFRGAVGGQPGDQTGTEVCVRSYYWEPWDGFLRYEG